MSKFWFFDRKGRPTSNEKRICDKFNSFLDDGSVSKNQVEEYLEEYGKPMNESELEEMFGFLTGNDSNGNKYEYADDSDEDYDDSDEDYDDDSVEFQEVNNQSKSSTNSVDFNPFEEPVIERGYTKGFQPKSQNEDDDSDSDDDDDSDYDNTKGFSDEDLKMPKDGESIVDEDEDEDIPEPEWANTGGFSGGSDDDDDEDDDEDYDDDEDGGKLGGDNLQDLTPAQKRKSAEKTAEALLNMYCQFVPMPFIKWSSFSEGKIQKMVFENKIDLSMQLENNVSVKDYIDGVNEQAQEVFKVSDETKEEIKDPLVDVLLEQDLALTPTQRLMLAVGGHLVTMGFSAFQLAQNNKQALETFEKFHIQMNQQKAPVYQEQQQQKQKKNPRPRPQDNLSKVEKESVEELMRQMANNSDDDNDYDEDDDIIDAEHDPSVEVSDDYGDDD
jgi:hypothetical protein